MDQFIHLSEFRVVICKKCQYAVLPSQIDSHFTPQRPHGLMKEDRQRIISRISEIDDLIKDEEALKHGDFTFPRDTAEPIIALKTPEINGFRCTFEVSDEVICPYVCNSMRQIQKHSWEMHRWKSTDKGGRPKKNAVKAVYKVPWRSGVLCQRFFVQGPKSGYFEVGRHIERGQTEHAPESQWEKLEKEIDQGRVRVNEAQRRKIEAMNESMEPNPWLRQTGWVQHLGHLDPVELQALVKSVKEDEEPELYIVHEAFQNMIRAAQSIAVKEAVGKPALLEANRKERGKKAKKPFNSKMTANTFKGYVGYWKQLLSYIIRCEDLEEEKRPGFKFTSKQRLGFDTLMDAVDQLSDYKEENRSKDEEEYEKARDEVQRRLLQFCIALLDHDLVDNEYRSAIISGLAVLGIREDKGWENPEDYTPKLSAIIKLARLMVIQMAYQTRRDSVARKVEKGISQEEAEEDTRGHVELVQSMSRRFMMLMDENGIPTPMDWMFETRTYGLHIRYSTAADGTISWRGDTILYQQIQFSMEQVRSMVQGLVVKARRRLITGLLKLQVDQYGEVPGQALPGIDWEHLYDNPAEQSIGWSFLKDIRNRLTVNGIEGAKWLAKRVIDEEELQKEMIQTETQPDQPMQWRKKAIIKYQREMEAFQEELLILMHCTGGQAARATEIIGIRHQNTRNGGVRNIFVEDGLVVFVTAYHKGYEFSEKIKVIQRVLPREVGELLVYYLWLVLPFWESIEMMTDRVTELSPFVWGDGKMEDEEKKRAEKDKPDNSADSHSENDSIQEDEENQALKRSRKAWTSERLRKIIQRESMIWMGVKLNISAWRQVTIAIARKYLQDKFGEEQGSEEYDDDDFDEDNVEGDSPLDLQAGHGTHVAGMIYARLISEGKFETMSQREQFRQVSQEWHRFLGFQDKQDTLMVRIGKKRKRSRWEKAHREMQLDRWKQLRAVNIYQGLEALLGPGGQFRGKQEPAINAIMMGESPVVAIMGTGCGKSMLFMLPASIAPGGTTIVVTPLVSLQGNMQERCEKARISSVQWKSQRPHDSASIVFVTPESAMTKGFAEFIIRLQEMHQLDRIVIDECHTILDGTPKFRPKLRQLGELGLKGVQMVYLTATLPPRDEDEFYQLTHISRERVRQVRGRTTRPNVQYQVQTVEIGAEKEDVLGWGPEQRGFDPAIQDEVMQVIEEKLKQYPAPAKIIVYCSVKKGAEKLAEALGCDVYHRDIDTEDGKARRLKNWMNASNSDQPGTRWRVIVATNALGLGIDVPDIRVVVHVGTVWRLKDYSQESGRAGRDGQRSEAIIIMPTRDGNPTEVAPKNEKGWVDIQEFVAGKVCRRVILDQVMDGWMNRERCQEGEEVCDICHNRDKDAQRQAVRDQIIEQFEEFQDSGVIFESSLEKTSSPTHLPGPPSSPPRLELNFPNKKRCLEVDHVAEVEFQQQEQERKWVRHQVVEHRRQEAREVEELRNYLEEWSQVCPLCHWRGGPNQNHRIEQCPRREAQGIAHEAGRMIKGIRYDEKFGCCHRCGIPQAICERWKQKEEQGWWEEDKSRRCQYQGVLIEVICTLLAEGEDDMYEEATEWIGQHQVDIGDEKQMWKWLAERVEWGGIEATRMTQVFHRLCSGHSV